MYNRLIEFINENGLLYKYQFGFQKGKSTSMALVTLIDKITDITLKWFKDYLSYRIQYVTYNGIKSMTDIIKCGVPQGSILGPLLFLMYINDLCQVSEFCLPLLFADDTNLFITG